MLTSEGRTTAPALRRWAHTGLLHVVALTAVAFALVAASVQAAPTRIKTGNAEIDSAVATTAQSSKCVARILKGGKYVDVYENYFAYKYKKIKGSKRFKRVVVKKRRKLMTSCARQCVRTTKKKGKRVPVYKYVRKTVQVKKGNRIVKAKKRVRVYTYAKCPKSASSVTGTPVKVTLLDGSAADLDFGVFKRSAPLSGTLSGFIPGGYQLGQDNQLNLTRGAINLGVTDIFIDDECDGQVSSSIKTGNPTAVSLDASRQSISTILGSGGVTANIYTVIKLPLLLRNDDTGCNSPYITTGYSEFRKTFFFRGKIDPKTGLAKLTLTAAPDVLDVIACLSPGVPTSPCNGFQIPLPIIVGVKAVVKIQVG